MSSLDLGPVRRWREGEIYYAENDFLLLAWAATDDLQKVGQFGFAGPDQIGVEFVSREKAAEMDRVYHSKAR